LILAHLLTLADERRDDTFGFFTEARVATHLRKRRKTVAQDPASLVSNLGLWM
jgi:hypothetical protein